MILVVGSTGMVGHEVCLRLLQRGERVRALVRQTSHPAILASLQSGGAELIFGDLKDPASRARACKGAEAVISTTSSTMSRQPGDSIQTVDDEGQLHLVEAARAAGIQRFIFVSFRRPEGFTVPLAEARRHVEEAIANLNYTIIRASYPWSPGSALLSDTTTQMPRCVFTARAPLPSVGFPSATSPRSARLRYATPRPNAPPSTSAAQKL